MRTPRTWTVLFKEPSITGRTAMRLSPDGTLTRRAAHAAEYRDRRDALQVAEELREQYPTATVRVSRFGPYSAPKREEGTPR